MDHAFIEKIKYDITAFLEGGDERNFTVKCPLCSGVFEGTRYHDFGTLCYCQSKRYIVSLRRDEYVYLKMSITQSTIEYITITSFCDKLNTMKLVITENKIEMNLDGEKIKEITNIDNTAEFFSILEDDFGENICLFCHDIFYEDAKKLESLQYVLDKNNKQIVIEI